MRLELTSELIETVSMAVILSLNIYSLSEIESIAGKRCYSMISHLS